jgi:TonB family protein
MKIFALLFVSSLLYSFTGFAQQKTWQTDKRTFTNVDSIHWFVDEPALFPGGQDALMNYLASNIIYPQVAQDKKIEGQVIARIVVHSNGAVSDVEILSKIGYGCDEEVVRVLSGMPRWKPAVYKGEKVAAYFLFPVNFSLDGKPKED